MENGAESIERALVGIPRAALELGLCVLAAIPFLPTLSFHFVYDDGWTILANGFLRRPDLALLLSPDAVQAHVPDAFRPTAVVLDVVRYQLFGLDARLWHLSQIVLHTGATLALFRWLTALALPLGLRTLAAALFAVHAVHAEAVAVVSFHEDPLAAALGLSALALLSSDRRRSRARTLAVELAAAGLLALACAAKASAAVLPGLWLLGASLSPSRPAAPWSERARKTAIAGLGVALWAAHQIHLHGSLSPWAGDDPRLLAARVPLAEVWAGSVQVHLLHLLHLVVPVGLSPEYLDAPGSWHDARTWVGAAGLAGLLAYGVWAARRPGRELAALAVLGTFLLALPTSNAIAMPNMAADRFMYLPSAPACLGLAAALSALGGWVGRRWPRWIPAPAIAAVVLHGTQAQVTAQTYRSDARLWEVALRRAPGSARAHAISGELLLGELRRARRPTADPVLLARIAAHCGRARELDPREPLGPLCAARLAAFQRRWVAAEEHFEAALALRFQRPERILAALAEVALDLPSTALQGEHREERAWRWLDRAMREAPFSPEVAATAAKIAHRTGQPDRARDLYARARELRPERWETVLAALELSMDLGDTRAALRGWQASRKVLPTADETARRATMIRLSRAQRLFPPSPDPTSLEPPP